MGSIRRIGEAGRTPGNFTLARLLLADRVVILVAIGVIAALCWLHVLQSGYSMSDTAMPMSPRWRLLSFALTFFMWSVMMAGMMLPGASPMILTFAALRRRNLRERRVEMLAAHRRASD